MRYIDASCTAGLAGISCQTEQEASDSGEGKGGGGATAATTVRAGTPVLFYSSCADAPARFAHRARPPNSPDSGLQVCTGEASGVTAAALLWSTWTSSIAPTGRERRETVGACCVLRAGRLWGPPGAVSGGPLPHCRLQIACTAAEMEGGFLPEPSEALPPRHASASTWPPAAGQRGTQPAPQAQQARVQRPTAAAAAAWDGGEPPDLELEAQGGCSRCPSLTFRSDWLKAFGVVLCNSCSKAERLISKVRPAGRALLSFPPTPAGCFPSADACRLLSFSRHVLQGPHCIMLAAWHLHPSVPCLAAPSPHRALPSKRTA